jgi:hypothetical protein
LIRAELINRRLAVREVLTKRDYGITRRKNKLQQAQIVFFFLHRQRRGEIAIRNLCGGGSGTSFGWSLANVSDLFSIALPRGLLHLSTPSLFLPRVPSQKSGLRRGTSFSALLGNQDSE